jgi:hypothetical protein
MGAATAGQEAITAQYDRAAPLYRASHRSSSSIHGRDPRGVAAHGLRPGDTILEMAVGTGRNLPYLLDAVA